jgi:hypothetical protein
MDAWEIELPSTSRTPCHVKYSPGSASSSTRRSSVAVSVAGPTISSSCKIRTCHTPNDKPCFTVLISSLACLILVISHSFTRPSFHRHCRPTLQYSRIKGCETNEDLRHTYQVCEAQGGSWNCSSVSVQAPCTLPCLAVPTGLSASFLSRDLWTSAVVAAVFVVRRDGAR